jgi:DNA repair exonuclease SbcCD nuclease subunit
MTDKAELMRRVKESSVRILLTSDWHLMDKAPRNATDSYTDDIFEILDFTAQLERVLNCDAVVAAGDLFHHKQPSRTSHRLVLRAIEAANKYRRLFVVTGNHDISNDRLETVKEQQPLGVLLEGSQAQELDGWAGDLPIFGIPWQQRWFEEGRLEEVFTGWRALQAGNQQLAITHAPIYPPALYSDQKFELLHPSDIAAAMGGAGNLYYGHIHDDHGIYEVDGVTFCNVGAVSRGSLTEYNLSRSIKAALWTPEHGFLEIDLPHKPAEEVFLLEQATAAKEKKLSNERFLEEVGSTRLEISSTSSVISYIEQLEDVEPEVKKIAIEMLELQDA